MLFRSRMLIDVIAERTGTDPGVELFPNLIHHVALGAIKAAIEMHLAGVGRSPEDLIRDAFGRLRLGFP